MDAWASRRRDAHSPAHASLPRTFYELSQVPLRLPYPRVLPAASSPPLSSGTYPPAVSVSHQPAAAPPTTHDGGAWAASEDAPAAAGSGSRTAVGAWWWTGFTGPSGHAATLAAVRSFVRFAPRGSGAAAPAQPQAQQQQQQARGSPPASDITLEARVWRDVMFSDLHLTQVPYDPRQESNRASGAGRDGDAAAGAAVGRRYATAASSEPQHLLSVPVSGMYVKASLVPASAARFYSIRWVWVVDNDTCQKARLAPKPARRTRPAPSQHADDRGRLRDSGASMTPDGDVDTSPPAAAAAAAAATGARAARGALADPDLSPGARAATGAAGGASGARGGRHETGARDAASTHPPEPPGPPPAASSDAHSRPSSSSRPAAGPPTGPLRSFWRRACRTFGFASNTDIQPPPPVSSAAAAPGVPQAPGAPAASLVPAAAAAATAAEDPTTAASVTCQGPAWEVGSDVDVVVQLVHRCTGERVLLRATDLSVGMEVVFRWWEVAWLIWMVLRHVMDVAFLAPLRQAVGWAREPPQRPSGDVREAPGEAGAEQEGEEGEGTESDVGVGEQGAS